MPQIFFSWQSDVAPNATTRAIRQAATAAAATATEKHGELVNVVEATSNSPGSPYIPGELARKIQNSDIFIGDITTIVQLADGKSLPNPNVTFELGLAAAHLGWDRIILLFNECVARFEKLPFDFGSHRISRYKIAEMSKIDRADLKNLTSLVTVAVETILDQKPLRPRALEGKSESKIKHDRDVVNIRWFLKHIDINLLDAHIDAMPNRLNHYAIVMSDGLEGVVTSSSFHLYDKKLEVIMRSLYKNLKESLSFSNSYRETNSLWVHAYDHRNFNNDLQMQIDPASSIASIIVLLSKDLIELMAEIRTNYLEIDIDETSVDFYYRYQKMVSDTEKEINED